MRTAFAALCAVLMVAALFVGGAQPIAAGLFNAPWDKLAHALFFFILVVLLHRCLPVPLWLLAGAVLILGAADEIHQLFLPWRTAGYDDWLADAVGVLLAVFVLRLFARRFVKPGTR